MIKSLVYIRIGEQPPVEYAVPLFQALKAQLTDLTTFEFDNFSEESVRQYAIELLKQSGKLAIVVASTASGAPVSGLTTFFNSLMKIKPESMLLVLQGEQALLQKMMQTIAREHFHHQLSEEQLKGLLLDYFSGS